MSYTIDYTTLPRQHLDSASKLINAVYVWVPASVIVPAKDGSTEAPDKVSSTQGAWVTLATGWLSSLEVIRGAGVPTGQITIKVPLDETPLSIVESSIPGYPVALASRITGAMLCDFLFSSLQVRIFVFYSNNAFPVNYAYVRQHGLVFTSTKTTPEMIEHGAASLTFELIAIPEGLSKYGGRRAWKDTTVKDIVRDIANALGLVPSVESVDAKIESITMGPDETPFMFLNRLAKDTIAGDGLGAIYHIDRGVLYFGSRRSYSGSPLTAAFMVNDNAGEVISYAPNVDSIRALLSPEDLLGTHPVSIDVATGNTAIHSVNPTTGVDGMGIHGRILGVESVTAPFPSLLDYIFNTSTASPPGEGSGGSLGIDTPGLPSNPGLPSVPGASNTKAKTGAGYVPGNDGAAVHRRLIEGLQKRIGGMYGGTLTVKGTRRVKPLEYIHIDYLRIGLAAATNLTTMLIPMFSGPFQVFTITDSIDEGGAWTTEYDIRRVGFPVAATVGGGYKILGGETPLTLALRPEPLGYPGELP